MATLTVWRFDGATTAEEAVSLFTSLSKQELIKIHDAATVSWEPGAKKPKTRQLNNLAGAGAMGGMFWGMLFGLLFFVPFLGAAVGAATGALAGSLSDVGISDDFIKKARDRITPGSSALFLMSSDAVFDKVKAAVENAGLKPELIESNLSSEQEATLREMIGS
jgi:uncharacterized membrane protein